MTLLLYVEELPSKDDIAKEIHSVDSSINIVFAENTQMGSGFPISIN